MVDNLKEAEERIRKAMVPLTKEGGQKFSPGINRMRQSARHRTPQPVKRRELYQPR